MLQLQSTFGVFALLAIAWGLGENRGKVSLRQAAIGLVVTLATAVILIKLPHRRARLRRHQRRRRRGLGGLSCGNLLRVRLHRRRRAALRPEGAGPADFVLAFQALPIVLVMSVLTTLLVLLARAAADRARHGLAAGATLGVGGAVGLSTAANVFLGMVEAPLFVRPYLSQMTRSELFLIMTGGMAGIAGTVLVLYATLLAPLIPDAAAHFVIASVLGAPAAILISLIMVPETIDARTAAALTDPDMHASSTMDAIAKGTSAGLELLLNIIAMLIVLVALVSSRQRHPGPASRMSAARGISLQRMLRLLSWRRCAG